jgi:poly-beta-1,6-N-acetyl-D-glucosamine synthase
MILLIILSGVLYLIVIGLFFRGWIKTKSWTSNDSFANIKVSVMIAIRNEESNILTLLQSLTAQSYPQKLFEIIIINDHSTDRSLDIIKSFNLPGLKIINLPENKNGKKAALLEGSLIANGELIITTDADCIPGTEWIKTIVSYYQAFHPKMIVAPVILKPASSFFFKFQELEFLSLQGSTAGAIAINRPIMCNGANLAFTKECLPIIQDTYRNTKSASGDDIFALLAVNKQFPGQIQYLKSKNAAIITSPVLPLKKFFSQRKRWTAKARFYSNSFLISTAFIVLIINLLLFILCIEAIFSYKWSLFLSLFIMKSLVDFPFLLNISGFFASKKLMRWFLVFQSFYFLYISFTFVLSLFGGYTWKSRKIST